MSDRYLRIYMNDHLALGVGWRELALRAARNNRGTELGGALERVAAGIDEDIGTFRSMMQRLGLTPSVVKPAAAAVGERLARLKLNGRVSGYSPLSRFVELDVLAIGIEGKKILWATLRDLAGLRDRLPDVDFDRMIERADEQHRAIEPFRRDAGTLVFQGRRATDPATATGAPTDPVPRVSTS
jgi:hypothetical protein